MRRLAAIAALIVTVVLATVSYAHATEVNISSRECVSFRTHQGGADITHFGDELFAQIDNHCGVRVQVIWCWKRQGASTCSLDVGAGMTGLIEPNGTGQIAGPTPGYTSNYYAIVCDMSDPLSTCASPGVPQPDYQPNAQKQAPDNFNQDFVNKQLKQAPNFNQDFVNNQLIEQTRRKFLADQARVNAARALRATARPAQQPVVAAQPQQQPVARASANRNRCSAADPCYPDENGNMVNSRGIVPFGHTLAGNCTDGVIVGQGADMDCVDR